jgi:hypothetical protein
VLKITEKDVKKSFEELAHDLTHKYPDLIKIIWFLPLVREENEYNLCFLIDIKKISEEFRVETDKIINEISKKENIRIILNIYDFEHFWSSIKKYSPILMFQIRIGMCIYDPTGLFSSIKKLLGKGKFPGTEEFANVLSKVIIHQLEYVDNYYASGVLSEIFNSAINASQAPLALIGEKIPKPKEIAFSLKENFVKRRMLEKKYSMYVERIVNYFKAFEHEKIKKISWIKLFSLYDMAKKVVDRMEALVDEIVSLSQIYETKTEEIDDFIKKHK